MQFPNYSHLSLSDSLTRVIDESDVSVLSCSLNSLTDVRDYDAHDELDEINIFASLDPILADLVKQFKDAEKQADYLENTFSDDDPMAEIAMDRKDSAWSMVQTRLIELREDEKFSGQVGMRLLVLEEERAGLVKSKSNKQKREDDFIARQKIDQRLEARDKKDHETDVLAFFLWMWMSKQWAEKSLSARNRLQYSFSHAA